MALWLCCCVLYWQTDATTLQLKRQHVLLAELEQLQVKDFLHLSDEQSERLTKTLAPNLLPFGSARLVFKRSQYVSYDWIVVLISQCVSIPGRSTACVIFVNSNGEIVNTSCFSIGYRQFFQSLKVTKYPHLQDYTIEIATGFGSFLSEVEPTWELPQLFHHSEERYGWYQTYAFKNNEVKLVRLLHANGYYQPNDYVHHTWGPPQAYTIDQVREALTSEDLVDALSVLVWLCGKHFESHYIDQKVDPSSRQGTSLADAVVQQHLTRYFNHPWPLVNTMANRALHLASKSASATSTR